MDRIRSGLGGWRSVRLHLFLSVSLSPSVSLFSLYSSMRRSCLGGRCGRLVGVRVGSVRYRPQLNWRRIRSAKEVGLLDVGFVFSVRRSRRYGIDTGV